jgi:WD40 repeat protein
MRGWEWSYLDWLSNPSLLTIRGGIEEFKILAFSKDTRRLFCGGADGRIQVRQADDGALLSTIEGHSRPVASLVVSPDDRLLLSSDEHELKMWDLAAGALLWRLPRPGAVSPDAFSPDGALVAAPRALEQRIVLLDARTGAEVRSLSVAGTGMCSAGFSPDGTHLLCELNLRTLLLDARSGALLWKADAWPGRYFPDGARVALWEGWWGPVRICDSASGKFLTRIADASRQIVWTISQDGTSLITQDSKGKTVIYDAADGEPFAQISAPAPAPKSNITAESDRFATTGADGTAKIWSTCTSAAPLVVRAVRDTFGGTVAADGSFSITVGWGDVVRYDTDTGAARWSTVVTRGSLEIAALSPDGKRVVVCGQDRRIRVLDTENGRLLYASSATSAPIHALAWSPDRQQLFAGGDDQSVQVLNADRGESLRILGSHASPVRAIAVSPDGSLIASGSGAVRNSAGTPAADHTVRIWETATGKPLHTLAGHTAAVNCIAFDPAGQRLLTGSDDQNVILWSIHGMRLATFSGAGASVRDVRFGPADVPERARVAAALEDGTLHIWNAGTGEELLVLRAPNGLYSAAFSSRPGPSAALIANGTNLALVAFETAPPECGWAVRRDVLRACKIVDRLFTEWQISDDVLEHLNTDSQIPDSIHPICIELVRARGDNVNRLNSETWGIAAEPSMSPEKYQTALRVAQHICRLWPEEYAFLNTRGVAEYRAGNYTDAIITLERCDAMHRAAHGTSHPVDLAVMAMAHQRLGNPDPARATLARARDALNGAAADRDALAFVHEAATLIEPP